MQSKQMKLRKMLKQQNLNEHPRSLGEQLLEYSLIFSTHRLKLNIFEDKDLALLSSVSRTFYPLAKKEQHRKERLLSHVVLGHQNEAEAIIKENPELLLNKSKAVDYSGRTIHATPFQAALGAGDNPMWEMMLAHMEPAEALRQFQEWFPNVIKDTLAPLPINYDAIALALIQGKEEGLAAIQQFREDITSQREITQGTHFNLQHLIAAYQAYNTYFEAFGDDWVNRDLFWKQVVGYVQRQMSTYDAQIHCSGVQKVLNHPKSFSRELKFDNGGDFFPLLSDSGLGFDFACYSYYRAAPIGGGRHLPMPGGCAAGYELKNYVEQKQRHLQDLESHLSKECVISRRSCICS